MPTEPGYWAWRRDELSSWKIVEIFRHTDGDFLVLKFGINTLFSIEFIGGIWGDKIELPAAGLFGTNPASAEKSESEQ